MNAFKITYNNGYSYTTSMNCELDEATDYFLGQVFTDENPLTGKETRNTVVAVEQVEEE